MLNKPECLILTRMEAVTGDAGALQPLGELVGEEDVAQLAVTVLQDQRTVPVSKYQLFVCRQTVEVHLTHSVHHGSNSHHATRPACLQPVQKQHCQQEVAQVIDAKDHPEAVLRLSAFHQT